MKRKFRIYLRTVLAPVIVCISLALWDRFQLSIFINEDKCHYLENLTLALQGAV
jgi:hypothetical protein